MGQEDGEGVESARGTEEREKSGKRKKEKWQRRTRSKEKKKIQARHSCLAGDLQDSEVYLIPYQDATICEVGQGDHPRTKGLSEISSDGPAYITRGGRVIHHQLV